MKDVFWIVLLSVLGPFVASLAIWAAVAAAPSTSPPLKPLSHEEGRVL
jgi:hypothetical protein